MTGTRQTALRVGWCVAGATFVFGFLSLPSIGLSVLPFGILLTISLLFVDPRPRNTLRGPIAVGAGLVLSVVAVAQLIGHAAENECVPGRPLAVGESCTTSSFNPWVWLGMLAVGLALGAAPIARYLRARTQRRRAAHGRPSHHST